MFIFDDAIFDCAIFDCEVKEAPATSQRAGVGNVSHRKLYEYLMQEDEEILTMVTCFVEVMNDSR